MADLSDWLNHLGLGAYAAVFADEGFEDADSLRDLSEDDLEKLGLKMAHRKKLLRALQADGATSGDAASRVGHTTPGNASNTGVNAARRLKLFLSYGRDDYADEARALRDALRARGHEVWFDEEQLASGLDWDQRIEKGLASCDCVVLTMTPHSVRRPDGYCLNELAKALELRKLIIPVLMVDVPQGAPTSICRIQYLDWRDAVPARERAERFAQRLQRLCEAIEEDKLDFEGGQQRLLRLLQPLSYDGDIQHHVARFVGRKRLEARLRAWLDNPEAPQRLWLTAAPGMGKSAVAATLVHRWGETAAVHFCVAGHQDKADPARAILSIAYQLAMHLDLYRARLASLHLEREVEKDARTLFETLLVGPLAKDFPVPASPWLVILDGLDEATKADGSNALAEVVAAAWGRLPSWLKLLVSSRPETEVQQWLSGTASVELRGADEEQQEDVKAYLHEQLAALGKPVSPAALARILRLSEGAFHYAVLLVEEVRHGHCDPENPVDLPAGLNQIHLQAFKRRFPDLAHYRSQGRPLLELILASPEPVPIALLAGAMSTNEHEIRRRLAEFGAMVLMEPAPSPEPSAWDTVRLSHASLRHWLTGVDGPTRLSLAGPYAALPDARSLAAESLRWWEMRERPALAARAGHGAPLAFAARALWPLLKAAGLEADMADIALDLSKYWASRKLALAVEPARVGAQAGWLAFQSGIAETEILARAADCLQQLGELQESLGDSANALECQRRALAIRERLLELEPARTDRLRELALSHQQIGALLQTQGRMNESLIARRKGLDIASEVAGRDAGSAPHARELGTAWHGVGSVQEALGDIEGAIASHTEGAAIAKVLAQAEPDNPHTQRDFGYSQHRLGGAFEAMGQTDKALEHYRQSLDIRLRLVERDPNNPKWLRELSLSHNNVGFLLHVRGNLPEALDEYRKCRSIFERLSASDPDNARWKRDLAVNHNRVGGPLLSLGRLDEAALEFQKGLALFQELGAQDPHNVEWQRDLGVSHGIVAILMLRSGELAAARVSCQQAVAILRTLRDPDHPGSLIDWAAATAVGIDVARAIGDSQALAVHEADLLNAEIPPEGLGSGGFRQLHVPLILKGLGHLIHGRDFEAQALLTLRALRLAARVPSIDTARWKELARSVLESLPPQHTLTLELSNWARQE
jgi:tetratricopeptide (TPR) repeat protein